MLRKGAAAGSGRCRAADWCPIFVRRCTIGVNAKLSQCERSFNLRPSSDAPRNEFAGGERGDNRGTKCPDPKALLDGIQQRFFICVHGFALMVHRPAQWPHSALAFAPRFFRASPRPPVVPAFPRFVRRRCAAVRWPFGLTRLACAKRVRYTQLSPTARSGKSVGSSPTSRMQKREYGWMSSAGRWIGAGRAAGAVRSSWDWSAVAAAYPSRSAACRRIPAPSPVVACASVSVFSSAFA
ncbi:hypothetical protein BLA15945_05018 [Burkholderia lata]|uniref:Uncharacterized protein n=1 Tax=Burkholderia lata (strain ATCC 17760 / DSM 23089 / LMG 22485 / NCIMB 9086 / R18194 / 383) TaxID=482957 RepID=A0A6P2P7S8_BURL3|nr:hypothetical protein BLA15945_05018 [Burkholderia lata]